MDEREKKSYREQAANVPLMSGQAVDAAYEPRLSEKARMRANEAQHDGRRFERLAERLTPEIENAIWCLQEAVALGLIHPSSLLDKQVRFRGRGDY